MLKKGNDLLAGVPATIIAGLFLLLDLVPHLMEEFGGAAVHFDFLPFDPAWVTVIISGIPMVYLAVWRVIHNPGISNISSALLITIAMFAAIGQATKHGVIIKSGEALEKIGRVDTIAFDKTGTLTYGRLEVSDIAVDAADIVLMSDDISRLPYLKRLSNATVKTIKFSISLSMCINFPAVTLSVLGVLNPTTGALVHNAGSCFVVLIAALLYDRKFD